MSFEHEPKIKRGVKIQRKEAYQILRNSQRKGNVPCISSLEEKVSERLSEVTIGRLVNQVEMYANNDDQVVELNRRCRAVNLSFFFDFGDKVQFREPVAS